MSPVRAAPGADTNVGAVLDVRTRRDPERTAIVSGETRLTYRELGERVDALAAGLAARGVKRGCRVALLLTNGHEHYEVLYACARLGAILVTVNYRLTASEIAFLLHDAEPTVLIHGGAFAETATAALAEAPGAARVVVGSATDGTDEYEALIAASGVPVRPAVALDDPLVIMYTSGTTGRPKGAMLSHGNLLWSSFCQLADWEVRRSDRCLVVAPLYHVGGMMVLGFSTLHVGGCVIVHESFDPAAALDAIERERVTTLFLAPTMWNMLLQEPAVQTRDVSSIRLCCSGGEALPLTIMERLIEIFGDNFTEGYGLTEATSSATVLDAADVVSKRGSVGTPWLHTSIRVVDDDDADVAPGERGEVLVGGPTVMLGYWRRPEASAAALSGGWLHTGDVGRLDEEGYLSIVDRKDDMIVSGAENVYPAEVEQLLYRHESILEACVIGLPDELWGQVVTAVVVPHGDDALSAEDVIEHCRGRIAGYKRPRRVYLVDELPRNPSGKVLKRVLRDELAGNATTTDRSHA